MIIQSLSTERLHTIELKTDKKYAGATSEGLWLKGFIKCLLRFIFRPCYYNEKKK